MRAGGTLATAVEWGAETVPGTTGNLSRTWGDPCPVHNPLATVPRGCR